MRLFPHCARYVQWPVLLAGVLFAFTAVSSGQSADAPSLGAIARKQREKQQTKNAPAKAKKIVTNEEMPEHPEATPESSTGNALSGNGSRGEISGPPAAGDVVKTGDQWKAAITQQKAAVADLKNHLEKLNGSIHFVEANAYSNGVEYNKAQAQKQQEVQRLQGQLDEQKKNLEQMQERARKAGFGSAVWDP